MMFEAAMHQGDFEKADWLPTLRKYITGRALAVYNEITPYGDISYSQFKADILERLGLIAQQARQTIWLRKPKLEEGPRSFLQPIVQAVARLRPNIITPQDAADELFQGVLLSAYSTDALLYLRQCNTKSHYHSAEVLQELWDAKSHYDKKKMLRTQTYGHQQPPQRRTREGWSWSKDKPTPGKEGEPPKIMGGVGTSGIVGEMAKGRAGMVPRLLSLAIGRLTKV